jgi:hypothetical protein
MPEERPAKKVTSEAQRGRGQRPAARRRPKLHGAEAGGKLKNDQSEEDENHSHTFPYSTTRHLIDGRGPNRKWEPQTEPWKKRWISPPLLARSRTHGQRPPPTLSVTCSPERSRGGETEPAAATMAAAAEWDSGSEAGPTGDRPAAAASPANGKTATTGSEAGASVSGESDAKVDDGNIQEAESSLREGLSLNYEVSATPLPLPARSWLDLSKCIR